jgi:Tat protein translocase TatB subunit
MFGIGAQEILIIALLFLVIFGPNRLPRMARDFGRFANEARRTLDEFKSEVLSEGEARGRKPRVKQKPLARREPQESEQSEEQDL